jgi:uncharacterized protein YlxP (DUF503 family)
MVIGTLKIKLRVPDSHSLKEKRRVVKSIKDRLKNKFNISVSEVDALDSHQIAVLGVATVSNDKRFVESVLSQVLNHVSLNHFAQIVDREIEVF